MKTKPSETIINDTIAALRARREELLAELAETDRTLRKFGALGIRRLRRGNLDAVEDLFANNGNAWLTVRAIKDALPACNRKSLRVSIYKYTSDGHLERRPVTAEEDRRGAPTRYEYRLAKPPTT